MRTVAEIQKEIKLNGHEMTADQIEALEVEMIEAENVECGVVVEEAPVLKTKKDFIIACRELVAKLGTKVNSYCGHYYGEKISVATMMKVNKSAHVNHYEFLKAIERGENPTWR